MFKMKGSRLVCIENEQVVFEYDVCSNEFVYKDEQGKEHRFVKTFDENVSVEAYVNALKETFAHLRKE